MSKMFMNTRYANRDRYTGQITASAKNVIWYALYAIPNSQPNSLLQRPAIFKWGDAKGISRFCIVDDFRQPGASPKRIIAEDLHAAAYGRTL